MAVRFVVGRAGSGKTFHCFDAIVRALRDDPSGPPIFWLLPRQATFMAERELTCLSGLRGFCRARVYSFQELGDLVLTQCGGDAVPLVNDLGRRMILGHLLRQHQTRLQFFASVAHQAGLAAELDATFAEFEGCGKTTADLADLLDQLHASTDPHEPSLLRKLHDVRLLYDAYCEYLGQDRLDPHRRLMHVLQCIRDCPLLHGATVYVDGVFEFTDYERRVLAALAEVCRGVEITLLIDPASTTLRDPHTLPHELSLFFRTEQSYRRLFFTFSEAKIAIDPPVLLKSVRRFDAPALARLEGAFFPSSAQSSRTAVRGLGVELIEAPDRRAEVDAAARSIRQLLTEGLRLRDIAVLARDLSAYHELIDASFREHEIPFFVDRRRTAAHHPLVQFTRCVLQIARHRWPHDAVITLIKTGLAQLDLSEADELENYVLRHRIRGGMWANQEPWNFEPALPGDDSPAVASSPDISLRIDGLRRRLVNGLGPLIELARPTSPISLRQIVLELFKLFECFNVRATLAKWMDHAANTGQLEQRGEHERVWTELADLFDQMVDLLGDEPVSLDDFQQILDSGLESFDLALTPQTVDQVLVGQVDRTRTTRLDAVILLGMNEGQFPHLHREDLILSNSERRVLRQRAIDLDPDTRRQLLDENLLAYVAVTRSSKRLVLTRSTADEKGRPSNPSPFWRRVMELFPDLQPQVILAHGGNSVDFITTPRQLVTSLMHWARNQTTADVSRDDPWPALYQWLATHACCDDAVDVMRYRAWRALSYDNTAALSPSIASQLFPSPLRASVSRIESFAACPFQHFARFGLELRAREDPDVTALDLSGVFHHVLENLVRQMLQDHRDFTSLTPAAAQELIRTYAQQVAQELRRELMLSSGRNRYLLERIEKTLTQVVAHQRAASARGLFRPAHAGVGFGDNAKLPPFRLTTPAGKQLLLHGRIDRVDLLQDQADVAVIDYHLSGDPLSLNRVYHGISLRLLVYLLVLEAHGQQLAGRKLTPVAAFYLQLLRRLEDVKNPDEATPPDDPVFDLQVQPRGIFDGRALPALDAQLTGGRSDVVKAYVKNDGQFGYRNSSDVADAPEFTALLAHVRKRLGELADQILAGRIDISPYRLQRSSPCPHCDYHSVCRFDPAINRYHTLMPMKREEVLKRVVEEAGDGG